MIRHGYFLLFSLILTACTGIATVAPKESLFPSTTAPAPAQTEVSESVSTPNPFPTNVRVQDDNEYRIPQMLGFDAIPPIYDPQFAPAQDSPLMDDELVMGLALDGEAKAYPVTVLRSREMVNDEIAGWPVLVSW